MEAVDDEPEQLVPGAEARPTLATECDLELLAQEQVLEEEALAAAQGVDERGQEEPEEFDHRGRIADRRHLGGAAQTFCPPTAPKREKTAFRPVSVFRLTPKVSLKKPWRRGWDSNPRYPCGYNGFRDRRLQPGSATSPAVRSLR